MDVGLKCIDGDCGGNELFMAMKWDSSEMVWSLEVAAVVFFNYDGCGI